MEEHYFKCFESNNTGTLRKRLGEWYTPLDDNNRNWQSYVHTTTKEMFILICEGVLNGYWKQIIAASERMNSLGFMSNTSMRLIKKITKRLYTC
jgi:hypothetical protein